MAWYQLMTANLACRYRATGLGKTTRARWVALGLAVAPLMALGIVGAPTPSGATPVPAAPSIKQSGGTIVVGKSRTIRITATGFPKPSFTESGALPAGMSFVAGAGSASLVGTPAAGSGNDYFVTFTATNSQGSDTEPYDLTVQQNPLFPPNFCPGPMTVGQYVHDDEEVAAYPAFFGLGENNSLPDGVAFNQNGNNPDLGALSGTPQPGSGGRYGLQFSSDANNTTRNVHCKLVVTEAPAFTDDGMAVVTAGALPTTPVTMGGTPGFPKQDAVTTAGAPPAGLTVHTMHNGKGFAVTLKGTPKAGTAGDYLFHVVSSNGLTASEDFVLVDQAAGTTPAATSLALSTEADPVPYDDSAQTYTATVSGGTTPGGFVQFSYGDGTTTVPLSGGTATFTTPASLDAGDYTVSATYTGDAANASSTATEDLTVSPAPTVLTVTGSTTSTSFGTPVTYTASVACVPSCGTTPTGSVDFNQEGSDNPVDLVNGQATFTTDPTVGSSLGNEVDVSFASFDDAPGDFAPSATVSEFYDVGAVNFAAGVGDGRVADGTTAISDGDTVTVDPSANNEFSVNLSAVVPGSGTPPGPVDIDVASGTTDETSQLGLGDGTENAPDADPGTGINDYFWTLPPGDLTQLTGTSATVTLSYGGSDDFVADTVTFTLDW
jgi:large repetitive protein